MRNPAFALLLFYWRLHGPPITRLADHPGLRSLRSERDAFLLLIDGPLEFSNNLYFPDDHSAFDWKDTVAHFSEWQTVSGLDKDSLIGDPRLASAAPNISGDFALSSTSLAVGRGADLGGENQMALLPSLA